MVECPIHKTTMGRINSKLAKIIDVADDFWCEECQIVYICPKCHGTKGYMYDENHGKICEVCCDHDGEWWLLKKHYGKNNGKMCCGKGCGFVRNPTEDEKLKLGL